MPNTTSDTLQLIKDAQGQAIQSDVVAKSFTQSASATTGLTAYSLEAPAKLLIPILTPLRNRIPREVGGRGIQANWRAITGINTGNMSAGLGEGQRSGAIDHSTAEYLAAFRGVGLDDYVTFESAWAAQGFDDADARCIEGLLRSVMIQEELLDLGGNTSVQLGTSPTPTLADVTGSGSLVANTAYKVRCVALTSRGYQQVAGIANGKVNDSVAIASATIHRSISRSNMDGSTTVYNGGCAQVSDEATITTANDGAVHKIRASVVPVRGAVAYAWFWGAVDVKLGAVTVINSVEISAAPSGSQNVTDFTTNAADNSTDSLVYDGMLTQIMKSGSGSYYTNLATGTPGTGTALTSNGMGGITEVDTAFAAFYDNYRLSPDEIYVSSSLLQAMNKLVIANGGAPLIRYNMDANGATITAGTVVGSILNPITNTLVKVTVHPNMPRGMMMFWSSAIPYSLSGITSPVKKLLRQDYYQIPWAQVTRRREYGVYFDGVLQNYFPPAFGILGNIAH